MQSVARTIVVLIVLLAGCSVDYYAACKQQERFNREFEFNRTPLRTPGHGTRVVPPRWLAKKDVPGYLCLVDAYLGVLAAEYPLPAGLTLDQIYVVTHDALDRFVSPYKRWVYSCHWEWKLVLAWRSNKDGLPAEEDPLPTLVHETLHLVAWRELGHGDANHQIIFKRPEALAAMAKARTMRVALSEESKQAAKAFVYDPWTVPK